MPTAYAPQFVTSDPEMLASELWRGGPHEYGGATYVAAMGFTGGNQSIRIAKTTNSGIAWTVPDTANEMLVTPISGGHGLDSVRIGNTLHLLGIEPGTGAFELSSFALATGLYGAVVTGGPVSSSSGGGRGNPGIFEVSASGTRKVIAYMVDNGGVPTDSALVVYDGSWHSPVTVANDSREIRSIAIDAADRIHLVTFTSANVYEEYIFDSSNTLTGPFTMYGPTSNSVGATGPGVYDSATDTIRIPILEVAGAGMQASVLEGTPSSAPVWTQDIAGNSGAFADWSYPFYVAGASPYLVFAEDGGNAAKPLVYIQKLSGVWGLRKTIFEPMFDPASPSVSTNAGAYGAFRPLAALLASGNLAAVGGYPAVPVSDSNVAYYVELPPCGGASSGNLYFAH